MARVSVGMPVYNGERYVAAAIESILGQTYGDLELVISDNASTDATEAICRDYARRDRRVRYVRQPQNVGGPANYRRVFELGSGEFEKWTNADDVWDVTFIEKAIGVLDAHADVVACYPRTRFIDPDGADRGPFDGDLDATQDLPSKRFRYLLDNLKLCHADMGLIRRAAMARTRLMTEERACDVHFVAELSLYGKLWLLPEYLFHRRLHPGASSWDMRDETRLDDYYDPGRRDTLGTHTWRKYARLAGAVRRAPIPAREKFVLGQDLLRRARWDRRALLAELRNAWARPAPR
jgi:glycosyltransferase involved in cell wall biosynthesis